MRISKTAAATLALALSLAACASDDVTDVTDDMSAMGDIASEINDIASEAMGDMDMGSSAAPRADEVEGATLRQADFIVLDGAPKGFAGAGGTAFLALDGATTLTVDVMGLAADTAVIGHLHAESCATNGGPHFKFDADGGDTPPNEVHIAATADDTGSFSISVTNEMAATDAMSVVIHAADGDTTKALCADLAG
ncbi:MAG: hypothetical protein ACI9AD_000926 [Nitriliruptoraceae bacterium]